MTGVIEQSKTDAAVAEERRGLMPAAIPQTKPERPVAVLVEHLTKSFVVGRRKKPVIAINDVSLTIRRGEIYGVLGANGSGKSTLIRLMSTLLTLDKGKVEVFGHDIERDEMEVKRLINRVSVDAAFKEAQPLREPDLRGSPVWPRCQEGEGRCGPDPGAAGHQREAAGPSAGADEPRHAAEGRHRAGAADQPGADAPGRADHRAGSAVEAGRADLRRGPARRARRHDRADHARPGRGGSAVRSDRDPERRKDRGRGRPARSRRWSPSAMAWNRRWRAPSCASPAAPSTTTSRKTTTRTTTTDER